MEHLSTTDASGMRLYGVLCIVCHNSMMRSLALAGAVDELRWDGPLEVLQYPHPKLRAQNARLNDFGPNLQRLAAEMFEIMYRWASKPWGQLIVLCISRTAFHAKAVDHYIALTITGSALKCMAMFVMPSQG